MAESGLRVGSKLSNKRCRFTISFLRRSQSENVGKSWGLSEVWRILASEGGPIDNKLTLSISAFNPLDMAVNSYMLNTETITYGFETLHWPLRLPLDHHGPRENLTPMRDVADAQAHEIAAAKLAVDGQAEHGEVTDGMRILKVDAYGPDFLRLKRGLLADQLPLIP